MLEQLHSFLGKPQPFTQPLAGYLSSQREHIDRLLKDNGVDSVRFGVEVEFELNELPRISANKKTEIEENIKQLRDRVLTDVADRNGADSPQFALAEQMNTAELVMYDLHYLDERTCDIVQPLFGTGRGDTSFYDTVGTLEAKIKPSESEETTKRLDTFLTAVYEKAEQYGFKPPVPPILHINMSFWRDGHNLCNPKHPEFKTTTANIINGMQRAIADAEICLNQNGQMPAKVGKMGIDRPCDLRIGGEGEQGRVELRFMETIANKDFPFILEAILKPGMAYGLVHPDPVEYIERGVFARSTDKFKMVLHSLQGSKVEATDTPGEYRLIPPKVYMTSGFFRKKSRTNSKKICDELGLRFGHSDGSREQEIAYVDGQQLIDIFEQVRLKKNDNGFDIIWPNTKHVDGHEYDLSLPHEELKSIVCSDIVQGFEHPGYNVQNRWTQMQESPVFSQGMLPELRESLDIAIQQKKKSGRNLDYPAHWYN